MSKEAIEKVVVAYYNNMAAMNAAGWMESFADDAVICDPVDKPPMNAYSDGEKFFALLAKFYDKLEVSPDHIFVAGNGAAAKWTMRAIAKNGKTASSEGITVFEMNSEGLIQKLSSYWDEAAMLAQLKG